MADLVTKAQLRAVEQMQWKALRFDELQRKYDQLMEDRSRWIRLFNRLDAAVSKHRKEREGWFDEDDDLAAAHDRILKAAARDDD